MVCRVSYFSYCYHIDRGSSSTAKKLNSLNSNNDVTSNHSDVIIIEDIDGEVREIPKPFPFPNN